MTNYTKEFWKEYNKNRGYASEFTKKYVKKMFNNPTLKGKSNVQWDAYFMVTGFLISEKEDKRRTQSRLNYTL